MTGHRPPVRCCVVGGGPAGMMLGLLLARAGVAVTVLEKHGDFLRDFRGDTVHPSTLQVLADLGLLERFLALEPHRAQHLDLRLDGTTQPFVDFRGLRPYDYLALIPQWDFLELLAEEARRHPRFELRMRHEVTDLVVEDGRVAGVRVRTPEGDTTLRADLVVGTDGRHSTVRDAANLKPVAFGAPMDVLWFRLPRRRDDPDEVFGTAGYGHMMVLIDRDDYWQIGYLVPKGRARALQRRPLAELRVSIARLAPFLDERTDTLRSWDDVKLLQVRMDRLRRWHRPGLLLIGDAAHAMSPVGGVGINLAIQDAVAAANALTPSLRAGRAPDAAALAAVQRRRMAPTKWTQRVQWLIQKRVVAPALETGDRPARLPAVLRWVLRFRGVRHIPARIFGYGFRTERVHAGNGEGLADADARG